MRSIRCGVAGVAAVVADWWSVTGFFPVLDWWGGSGGYQCCQRLLLFFFKEHFLWGSYLYIGVPEISGTCTLRFFCFLSWKSLRHLIAPAIFGCFIGFSCVLLKCHLLLHPKCAMVPFACYLGVAVWRRSLAYVYANWFRVLLLCGVNHIPDQMVF